MDLADKLWIVLINTWWISEAAIALVTRTRKGGGLVRDRGTLPLLWATIFFSIWGCLVFRATHSANMPGDPALYGAVSLALLIFGIIFRWAAVLSLGRSFSVNVAIRPGQTVLKTGFYRWMRHPSYAAMLFCFLAVGLRCRNWISLLIVLVFPIAALLYRIHVEEIALRDHFGQEYVDYSAKTKRLIPGIY